MTTTGLKQRKRTWYARLFVPRPLRPILGKSEVMRSLKTRDLAEANRRKHAVLAELVAELGKEARGAKQGGAALSLVEIAAALRADVDSGLMTEEQAEAAQDATTERILERERRKPGGDPAKVTKAVRAAYRTLAGEQLLSGAITDYLAERAPHIRKQTLREKDRHLRELAEWLGPDATAREVTKQQAGRYVADSLLKKGHSPKTTKDTLSNLSAFWGWLEGRGLADFNVWHRMSGTVRGSTRGREAVRRPWSDAELLKLLQGIPAGDPLLPMVAIAAYSGMRREEIAQLKAADVADNDAFMIREGKSAAAVRRVPIHPAMRPLVGHLATTSKDGFLIPGLLTGGADSKRAHYVGKRFTLMKRSLGFTDSALVFHTFRHAFTQRCEEAGIPESTAKLLVGHSRQDSLTYGNAGGGYSPGVKFKALRDAVVKVTYGKADGFVKGLRGDVEVTRKSARRYKRGAQSPRKESA